MAATLTDLPRLPLTERIDNPDAYTAIIEEVQKGLGGLPRTLAPWLFYDTRGSELFELITHLDEYYPARLERELLLNFSEEIVTAAGGSVDAPFRIVELGAGSASKTVSLINASSQKGRQVSYMPIDVSSAALASACATIALSSPQVHIRPLVCNYVSHPPLLEDFAGRTMGMYIGSSIGNFSPKEAVQILVHLRSQLHEGDSLLLGTDLVKDRRPLIAAYDDSEGITAAFNLNVLQRLNRELGANFDLNSFRHKVLWNEDQSRIEMHLESTRDQDITIDEAGLSISMLYGESIHTENSYKFNSEMIDKLLGDAGFESTHTWIDDKNWYALTLARLS